MIQYALKLRGKWMPRGLKWDRDHWAGYLPRDCDASLSDTPELWVDKARAEELARKHTAQVVKFEVVEVGERDHM